MARHDFSAGFASTGSSASADAYLSLGVMHAGGRDGASDLVAAHACFNLAASRGNAEAARRRDEIAREMTPAELAAALREARRLATLH